MAHTPSRKATKALLKYQDWTGGTARIGDRTYHTLNPKRHEHVKIAPVPKDSIWLEDGFVAQPVYQTEDTNKYCAWCTNVRFLGYVLIYEPSGHGWHTWPRSLEEIRAHHAEVAKTVKAAKAIARVGRVALEQAQLVAEWNNFCPVAA